MQLAKMGGETQCLCRGGDGITTGGRAAKDEDSNAHSSWFESSCSWLREQDSNLQPCGYGRFQDFHPGPDYLITLAFGCPKLRHLYVRVSGADGAYRREIRIP